VLRLFAGKAANQVQVVEYTERSQDKHESRHVQLVREYGFHPRSKVQVEDGSLLPRKFEPFPEEMYGRPLEEIDHCIYEEVSTQKTFIAPNPARSVFGAVLLISTRALSRSSSTRNKARLRQTPMSLFLYYFEAWKQEKLFSVFSLRSTFAPASWLLGLYIAPC
jgi:hypothetical protein